MVVVVPRGPCTALNAFTKSCDGSGTLPIGNWLEFNGPPSLGAGSLAVVDKLLVIVTLSGSVVSILIPSPANNVLAAKPLPSVLEIITRFCP